MSVHLYPVQHMHSFVVCFRCHNILYSICLWFISLNIVLFRSIHIVANGRIHFYGWVTLQCVCVCLSTHPIFLIHSSIDGSFTIGLIYIGLYLLVLNWQSFKFKHILKDLHFFYPLTHMVFDVIFYIFMIISQLFTIFIVAFICFFF